MHSFFKITTDADFRAHCLETFEYQYKNVGVYRKFVDYLQIDPAGINQVEEIPFLPIEMFKKHQITDGSFTSDLYFQSSGTTQQNLSKHYIAEPALYEESIVQSFSRFLGKPSDYIFLGLLPSYLEKQHSSLIYMVNHLMNISGKPENGYYLYNHADLFEILNQLAAEKKRVILFGVSFALLDFMEALPGKLLYNPELTVIETGGMKGRKEEMTKDELLSMLQKGLGTERIYSEYSMTELLSQAYSLGGNVYQCPPWMRILIRNTEDPFSYMPAGRNGAVNIIDLANRHSCSFIATQDLGKITGGSGLQQEFQVMGRIDHSDIRGCSLLVS